MFFHGIFNTLSNINEKTEYDKHTKMIKGMKYDLDFIFKRVRTIRERLRLSRKKAEGAQEIIKHEEESMPENMAEDKETRPDSSGNHTLTEFRRHSIK